MKRCVGLALILLMAIQAFAQSFEIVELQDTHRGNIGETIKAPLAIKNLTDKPLTLIISKLAEDIGGTQKSYFCLDGDCLDRSSNDILVKINPNQTYELNMALDAGLATGNSTVRYAIVNKSHTSDFVELDLHFAVEEKKQSNIYSSPAIVLHDVYPNPMENFAYIDYKLLKPDVKAKIVIHNILGNIIDNIELPAVETRVKLQGDALNSGIYFYTLHLDNDSVVTRKLIVKK